MFRELLPAAGVIGAVGCLAAHIGDRVRRWGPQALALFAMLLTTLGTPTLGRAALGTVITFGALACTLPSACSDEHEWRASVDIAAMAALMTVMTWSMRATGTAAAATVGTDAMSMQMGAGSAGGAGLVGAGPVSDALLAACAIAAIWCCTRFGVWVRARRRNGSEVGISARSVAVGVGAPVMIIGMAAMFL